MAIVLALVAIFLSMGGAAYAATSLVQTKDIANGAVTAQKLAPGVLSPAQTGTTFTEETSVVNLLTNGGTGGDETKCASPSDTPIGGGYEIDPTTPSFTKVTGFAVVSDEPVTDLTSPAGTPEPGWRVVVNSKGMNEPATLTVYAICASS